MNAKCILFPTDFSRCSDDALEYATALARECGGTLLIVHVEEPPIATGPGRVYYRLLEPDAAELQRMLVEVLPTDPIVPCEHRLLRGNGDPATQIVRLAKDEGVALIVMGTLGRTGGRGRLTGGVAESVARQSSCPVVIMKQGIAKSVAVA